MNAGAIWWGQIGNSLRFLDSVADALQDCRSLVLQGSQSLPWRRDFYEAVDIRRSVFSSERRLVRLSWEDSADPGQFILEKLCSSKVRAEYWPGLSYAAYLGSLEGIVLNEYYVWITDIQTKTDISKWAEFISQYSRHSGHLSQCAVFILEYSGVPVVFPCLASLTYAVEIYDCRVFCLEAATALKNTDSKDYQAELALCIGGSDPELCSVLLKTGTNFLLNPVKIARQVISFETNSSFEPFAPKTDLQLNSAAWKAAIVLLFPILEHCRISFVEKYANILSKHLPISNSNGDRITDPYNLEIGSICYIVGMAEKDILFVDIESIRLCRKARNLLAHNKPLPYSDVAKVLSLTGVP